MSVTDGTGRMPRPIKYRLYSARVQLVPKGMGAHTNKRKALPSGAAMAAADRSDRGCPAADSSSMATNRGGSLLVSYSR